MDGTERNIFETTNHHCSQVLWTQESYCDIVAMLNPQAVFIRYQVSSARDSIHIRATVGSPDLFLEIALRLKHQQRNIANCYPTYWIFLPQNHISRITVVSYCSTYWIYWMLQEQMSKINQIISLQLALGSMLFCNPDQIRLRGPSYPQLHTRWFTPLWSTFNWDTATQSPSTNHNQTAPALAQIWQVYLKKLTWIYYDIAKLQFLNKSSQVSHVFPNLDILHHKLHPDDITPLCSVSFG